MPNDLKFNLTSILVLLTYRKSQETLPKLDFDFSYDITMKYMEVLSDEEITKLYKIYADDFMAFEYTFQIRNLTLP